MPHGDILGFSPPLCITKEEVDIVIEKARLAVTKVAAELESEGILKAA